MEESECRALRVRMNVERLVWKQTAQGASGDISDSVVAGLSARHSNVGQAVQEIGNLGQRDELVLDVLTSGEVALARAELVGDIGQLPHLRHRYQTARNLGPD